MAVRLRDMRRMKGVRQNSVGSMNILLGHETEELRFRYRTG